MSPKQAFMNNYLWMSYDFACLGGVMSGLFFHLNFICYMAVVAPIYASGYLCSLGYQKQDEQNKTQKEQS